MLEGKIGDQCARAELLGHLLWAMGERPYILCHGKNKKDSYYIVMLKVNDVERKEFSSFYGKELPTVRIGIFNFLGMPLEEKSSIGLPGELLYNPENKTWTAAIEIHRFKPEE